MPTTALSSQLGVLALLVTTGLLGLLLACAIRGHLKGRPAIRRRLLVAAASLATGYLLVLFGAGLTSRTTTIGVGDEKYFCEIDCHLAYKVAELHSLSRSGATPDGRLWAVTIDARFDSSTISPRRDRTTPVYPAPRRVVLAGDNGIRYAVRTEGSQLAELSAPLVPGQELSMTLLFELPAGIQPRSLLLTDALGVSRLLIGHERSPFHAPILLALPRA